MAVSAELASIILKVRMSCTKYSFIGLHPETVGVGHYQITDRKTRE